MKRAALAIAGILGGVLFAAGAGTGISVLVTRTYWSAKYTVTVTLVAFLIAYFSFRMARRAITGGRSKIEP